MALNLQSLSITSAFNSIVNFFRGQENNSKWRDLSTNSEGSFLMRMLANVMSTLSYRIVAQSRENYLSTAALSSSNIGIAVNLGYSAFRGSNLKRLIQITPNSNYTLPKFSVIGTYNSDYNILTLEDVELEEGVTTKVKTVVGNVREDSFITGTSDIKIFSLFTSGISEDFILFKDSIEVPTTKVIKEMIYDKYLVRTNPYGSVDIAYLNTFSSAKYKYGTGTEMTIRYVELANAPVIPYTSSMFTYGTLGDVVTISSFIPFESVNSMKITAPLDHETQNLIRSKVDYANRLGEIIPSVTQTNYKALTPTYTLITYLKDTSTLLTGTRVYPGSAAETAEKLAGTEVDEVRNILKEENFFGTPLPDITVPRREVASLSIKIALKDKYKSISDINIDIDNILRNYYNRELNITFNVYDLERLIEGLSYVKYARVSLVVKPRAANELHQLGDIVEAGGNYYKASKILGYSGATEPANGWKVPINPPSEIDTDIIIQDGSVYWKCFKRLPGMPSLSFGLRSPSAQYGIGDYMYLSQFPDYMFKCVDIVRTSGGVSPDTTGHEPGDFIEDGGIVWVVKDYVNDDNTGSWESLTQYQLGQSVNAKGDYSLECVSYRGSTGTDENIQFEQYKYPVVGQEESVGLDETIGKFYVEGDLTYYFRKGDAIEGYYEGGVVPTTFSIVASQYWSIGEHSGQTEVRVVRFQDGAQTEKAIDPSKTYVELEVPQRGTLDGNIEWTLIDNIEKIKYDWNSFVTFTHSLEIIEG